MKVIYNVEQIDEILRLLAVIASDSKSFECSLPMMSVVLDINNLLRQNAVILENDENDNVDINVDEPDENTEESNEVVFEGGGAE